MVEFKSLFAPTLNAFPAITLPNEQPHSLRYPLTLSRRGAVQVFEGPDLMGDSLKVLFLFENEMLDLHLEFLIRHHHIL